MEYWLQYVFTEREYAKLIFLVTRKEVVEPSLAPDRVVQIRAFVRLFIKAWATGYAIRKLSKSDLQPKKFSTALVACALSYRLLYRYLTTSSCLPNKIEPIKALAAPISGALSGYILARGLPVGLASYVSVYLASKVCEWGYNVGDDQHKFDWKPEILGTWALFPFAFAQLFHSLILSPETCPKGFKRPMVALSNGALKPRSNPDDVVLGIAHASLAYFPRFRSPLIYRSEITTSRLVRRAHPGNASLIGALIHPQTDNDTLFFVDTICSNLTVFAKYLLPIYLIRAYLRKKSYKEAIVSTLRIAVTYSMTAASAIAGIQLSQKLLGRNLSPKLRFRIIGFLSGLWAILNQENGRAQFLYATRLAVLSLIPIRSQSVMSQILMPLSMACAFSLLNKHPEAITQNVMRKIGHWVQTGKWVQTTVKEDEKNN